MSDLLTHWAIYDDSRRLAAADPRIVPDFVTTMTDEAEFARLGAITRFGNWWMPVYLRAARDQWPITPPTGRGRLAKKLAFALGGITHFAPDLILKPLMSVKAQADWNTTHHEMAAARDASNDRKNAVSVREVSAYYDCHVFRKVYLAGNEQPFNRFFMTDPQTGGPAATALEAFARTLFQRALLGSHTIAAPKPWGDAQPDYDKWLDELIDHVQPFYIGMDLYLRVFTQPDPVKAALFGVETEFYRDDDPIITVARAVQQGRRVEPAAIDAALAEPDRLSAYGRSLALSLTRLRDASAFWRGERAGPPSLKQ